jgi:hypothetical protein
MTKLHLSARELSASFIPALPLIFGKLVMLMAVPCLISATVLAQGANDNEPGVIPFAEARMIIELNATDEDVGIQVFLDGEPWQDVKIVSPDGSQIFQVQGQGVLRELGLTELFSESNEPPLDELPLGEFFTLFPEGEYKFFGTTVEGDQLVGTATFTHAIPEGPFIISPEEDAVVDPNNTVIMWEPVTDSFTGSKAIAIGGYQVIVDREDPDPFRLLGTRSLVIDLPASATSVTVPPEFLEPATEYSFEVLAIDVSGNQTISESAFITAP